MSECCMIVKLDREFNAYNTMLCHTRRCLVKSKYITYVCVETIAIIYTYAKGQVQGGVKERSRNRR